MFAHLRMLALHYGMVNDMPYRSSEKTRQKKDAKRTALMQAALGVFAQKGYHSATIRDVVKAADVAVGTFYFYFPDKETLFGNLYDESADFLLPAIRQAINGRATLIKQVEAAVQAYVNIALYEPAVVHLLLVGGIGAAPSLTERHARFRETLVNIWQRPLAQAMDRGQIVQQNTRRTAEALAGAFDEVILHLLNRPDPDREAAAARSEMVDFAIRAVGYTGPAS